MEKKEGVDECEKHKMWAAISFAIMLIVIGIPLWWKTTEVERAFLPYDQISQLTPHTVQIQMNVYIYCQYPSQTNSLIKEFQDGIKTNIYNLVFIPFKLTSELVDIESIENNHNITDINPGDVLLIEVPKLPEPYKVYISNKRTLYFAKNSSNKIVVDIVKDWFLKEDDLRTKINSIVVPQMVKNGENLDSLRASLRYDIVFTAINADPENVKLVWDIESDVKHYVKPLLDQISSVSKHLLKSQWLYFINIGEIPKKSGDGYVLTLSQLPHIITPLEKKLGSGISKNPCVHLILYTSMCSQSPLSFVTSSGDQVDSMISPQWGSVQILNPSLENCRGQELRPKSEKIMSTFVSQLHTLLGIRNLPNNEFVGLFNITGSTLRLWELDNLYRMRAVEQITSASLTLQSLSKLLGEISNIVINSDVAGSINVAIKNLKLASSSLKISRLDEALDYSRAAYEAAEKAFSDPSLLALLYFPDDQKYAVYIPLFLPIMIPVLMSLKKIQSWLMYGTTN